MTEKKIDQEHADHLIQLIINQDQCFQSWMKFMIMIEIALAGAYAVILNVDTTASPLWVGAATMLRFVIPVIGIVVIVSLTAIMVREHKWQHFYVRQYNLLPNSEGKVFPSKPDQVSKVPVGDNSRPIIALAIVVGSLWLLAIWVVAH